MFDTYFNKLNLFFVLRELEKRMRESDFFAFSKKVKEIAKVITTLKVNPFSSVKKPVLNNC